MLLMIKVSCPLDVLSHALGPLTGGDMFTALQ